MASAGVAGVDRPRSGGAAESVYEPYGFANSDGRTDLSDLQRDRVYEPHRVAKGTYTLADAPTRPTNGGGTQERAEKRATKPQA
jgi:hypothetical protein